MNVDKEILIGAAENLRRTYGDTSDLPEELVNTLANIEYQFHRLRKRMTGSPFGGAFSDRGKNVIDAYKEFMENSGHILASVKIAPDMIKNVREIRTQNPEMYEFLIGTTLDILKYRLEKDDVLNKSEAERALLRGKTKVDEIDDLAKLMNL